MFRATRSLLLAALATASGTVDARAQARTEDCNVVGQGSFASFGQGEMVFLGGGARFTCKDGRTIRSDSVARYRTSGIVEFIGRVRYTDKQNTLTAGNVRYLERDHIAMAQTNVVLTDRQTGSVIRAPAMTYYEATQTRPESRIEIAAGRPHAVLVAVVKTDTTKRDTTVVDADAMDIGGRDSFQGRGNVVLVRGDLRGTGGSASYAKAQGDLRLWSTARLTTPDYTLSGDSIQGRTDAEDRLEQLTSYGSAKLDAKEVDVNAPLLRIFLEEGEVSRLVAVGAKPAPDGLLDPTLQAVALSEDFRMTADSIDALAPKQALERVTAVGRAFGERITGELGNANVAYVASRDWMKGDTIVTTFVQARDTVPGDTARPRREVESVLAVGGSAAARAASVYRVKDEKDPSLLPAINYLLARRILAIMANGEVASVQAAGEVQAVYLQPDGQPAAAAPGRVGAAPPVRRQ